jgi:hypothetical protein
MDDPVAGEMIPATSAMLCQLVFRAQKFNPRQGRMSTHRFYVRCTVNLKNTMRASLTQWSSEHCTQLCTTVFHPGINEFSRFCPSQEKSFPQEFLHVRFIIVIAITVTDFK